MVAYDVRNATFDDPRLSLPYGSFTASPTTTHLMISFFRADFVPLVSGVDTWAIAAGQGSSADVHSMWTYWQVLLNRTGSCECGDSEIRTCVRQSCVEQAKCCECHASSSNACSMHDQVIYAPSRQNNQNSTCLIFKLDKTKRYMQHRSRSVTMKAGASGDNRCTCICTRSIEA